MWAKPSFAAALGFALGSKRRNLQSGDGGDRLREQNIQKKSKEKGRCQLVGGNNLFDKGCFVFRVCREALALAAEVDLLAGRRGSVEEHWGQSI